MQVWVRYDFFSANASIGVDLSWYNKTRTRQPEAHWINLHADLPPVAATAGACNAWAIDKLGSFVCMADAITNGSPHIHAIGDGGALWQGGGGSLKIKSLDAGLVCLGYESAFPTDGRPMVALNGSAAEPLFISLHNNFWTTNYPNWYPWTTNPEDANGRYRFELDFA